METQLVSHCPHCRSAVKVRESHFGQPVRCPKCKEQFAVSSIETPFSASASLAAAPAAPAAPAAVETLATNGSAPTVPESLLAPPAPQARARLGRIGRFELSRLLGQGAFGRVYQAYDPQLERYVALKVPIFGPGDKKRIQRFLEEAKAAARLRHPNIVPTYESGQIDGKYYIAAHFIPGHTLSQRLKDAPIDFRQAADWVRQLAEALAYAHFNGIIHRDIKPDNIMIDEKGVPQIMDFGLAKRVNEDAAMTTDGSILGTPAYMAPEQARGNQVHVGPHSDQYSLGVVLYELLTGERPFTGPTHAVIEQLLGKEPPAPRSLRREIPPDLEAICHKAMSKEISGRYASTAELAGDLACFLRGDATLARPILLLERAARWGRRNPVVAALSGALGLVVLMGITGVSIALWKAESAKQQLAKTAAKLDATVNKYEKLTGIAANAVNAVKDADELRKTESVLKAENASQKAEITEQAVEIAELTAVIQEHLVPAYRDSLQRASVALDSSDLETAKRELLACPPFLRAWEWDYLMARAVDSKRVEYSTEGEFGFPSSLQYSDDGKLVLVGYEYPVGCTITDLAARDSTTVARNNFDPNYPWVLSADTGQEALVFKRGRTNRSTTATPFLHSWRTDEPPRALQAVSGFALDSKQIGGRWRVITSQAHRNWGDQKLSAHVTMHTYTPTKSGESPHTQVIFSPPADEMPKPTERFYNLRERDWSLCWACFDELGEQVHVFLQVRDFFRWYGIQLNGDKPEKPELLLEVAETIDRHTSRVLDPFRRPYVSQGKHLVFNRDRGGRRPLVVYRQRVRDDLRALLHLPQEVGRFDPQGKRLFIVRDEELQIFDPNSTEVTTPLLKIPLSYRGSGHGHPTPVLAFSPSGKQLAVAFSSTVTFFDVSVGD